MEVLDGSCVGSCVGSCESDNEGPPHWDSDATDDARGVPRTIRCGPEWGVGVEGIDILQKLQIDDVLGNWEVTVRWVCAGY